MKTTNNSRIPLIDFLIAVLAMTCLLVLTPSFIGVISDCLHSMNLQMHEFNEQAVKCMLPK